MALADLFKFCSEFALENPIQFLVLLALVSPVTYIVANEYIRAQSRIPGLKGPPGIPLIGNIRQIRVNAAEKYRQWAKQWGDVYQIQLGNIPVVVINSAAAAKVLFSQNAQALSSRPEFYTFHKVSFPMETVTASCLLF